LSYAWYIVAGQDRALSPDLEQAMAKTIKAATSTLPASHLVMLSRPTEVAAVILEAARKAASR
jgi:pimeloyl-ACP methyl ester carboxylesterase